MTLPRQSRSLARTETRITAYVPTAERLTVLDPETEQETSGETVAGDISQAVPIAQSDGIALVGKSRLEIRSGGVLTFDALNAHAWDSAKDAASFAFAVDSGLRIIRYLKGGTWQDDVLAWPEATATDLASTHPLISSDGMTAVLVAPAARMITVFQASSDGTAMQFARTCKGAASGSPWVTATFDDQTLQVLLGDDAGHLERIAVGDCASAAPIVLANTDGIARIARLDATTMVATQAGGWMTTLTNDTLSVATSYRIACDFPLAPTAIANERLAVLCLDDVTSNADNVTFQEASVVVLERASGAFLQRIPIDYRNLAALALAPAEAKIFQLKNDSLGTLMVTDLASGASHTDRGIFLGGVLNNL